MTHVDDANEPAPPAAAPVDAPQVAPNDRTDADPEPTKAADLAMSSSLESLPSAAEGAPQDPIALPIALPHAPPPQEPAAAPPGSEATTTAPEPGVFAQGGARPDEPETLIAEPGAAADAEDGPPPAAALDSPPAAALDSPLAAALDTPPAAALDSPLAAVEPDMHEEPAARVLGAGPPLPAEPAVPPRLARYGGPLETPASAPAPHITVLQPLTPLKDVKLPKRPVMPEDERRLLHTWSLAMERALRDERPADAVRLAHPVLRQLPRHLSTYYRLVRAAWLLRRWDEGDTWGRRLLRADPSNALAWRAVAMAVEQRGERARAAARWQRAFESDPYEPEVRAGLGRTSLDMARLPQLNNACLGSLLLRGLRWEQAVAHFERLTATDNRRLDFQSSLLLALWQNDRTQQAYELARRLAQAQPYLLIAWVVIDEVGDDNDKALARHPLSTMDPDGDYVRSAWGLSYPSRAIRLTLTDAEKALIEGHMVPAHAL